MMDRDSLACSGSRVVADGVLEEEEISEVVGKFGGPCRGRTYGPLIKSERKGMTQVVECLR